MQKLTAIPPTSADVATAHARRIVKSVNDLVSVLGESYADQPATGSRQVKNPQTGALVRQDARPGCAKADIQARLGAANVALVEGVLTALTPAPAASAPAPVVAAPEAPAPADAKTA